MVGLVFVGILVFLFIVFFKGVGRVGWGVGRGLVLVRFRNGIFLESFSRFFFRGGGFKV